MSGYESMELIYGGTRDGITSQIFHQKFDNQGPTICFYINEKGYIFGGYAFISWSSQTMDILEFQIVFIMLTNVYNTESIKFKFKGSSDSVFQLNFSGSFWWRY